jgi:hypothetical protein
MRLVAGRLLPGQCVTEVTLPNFHYIGKCVYPVWVRRESIIFPMGINTDACYDDFAKKYRTYAMQHKNLFENY